MSFKDIKTSRNSRQRSRVEADHSFETSEVTATAGPSSLKLPVAVIDNNVDYSLPEGIECRRSEESGRGLYATKRFLAGTRILVSNPAVSVLSISNLADYCSGCKLAPNELAILNSTGDLTRLRRCTGCRMAHYCSPVCQKNDWTWHKEECTAHQKLRNIYRRTHSYDDKEGTRWIMNEVTRALGRLCWARKRDRRHGKDPEWWSEIKAMESHVPRSGETEKIGLANTVQHLRMYLSAAAALSSSSGSTDEEVVPADMGEYGFDSSLELLDLVSALRVNSFTLSSPSLSPIGVAMSPVVALCNHSCEPNAVVVFPKGGGKGMQIITIRDIQPKEEILTSYIDVSLPQHERRKDLKERYGFDCDCTLCIRESDDKWVDPRWCIRHSGCTSNGEARIPDLERQVGTHHAQCDTCGEAFALDVNVLKALVDKGRDVLRQDESGTLDHQKALKTLSTLLPSLLHYFPPSSHPVLALLRLHSLLLTPPATPTHHSQAVSSLAKAYAGAELVHPPNHPTLAIILAEWGKLLALELENEPSREEVGKRLFEAVVVLRKAFTVAEKGFGPGGAIVGMEVEGLIRGCQGELELLRTA